MLGAEMGSWLDLAAAEGRVTSLLADFGLTSRPHTEIRHLALGQRQRVEIIKVLFRGSQVLLFDEPTSVLTPGEVTSLLDLLRRLRDEGIAVVLITHKLGEALEVSDRVTILRGGRNAGDLGPDAMSGASRESVRQCIVEQMFGGCQPPETRLLHAASKAAAPYSRCATSRPWEIAASPRCMISRSSCTVARSSGSRESTATARKSWARSSPGRGRLPPGQVLFDGVDITNRGSRSRPGSVSATSPTIACTRAQSRPPASPTTSR